MTHDKVLLTSWELYLLDQVAAGDVPAAIAEASGVDAGAVADDLAGICRRLGVETPTAAVRTAIVRSGLRPREFEAAADQLRELPALPVGERLLLAGHVHGGTFSALKARLSVAGDAAVRHRPVPARKSVISGAMRCRWSSRAKWPVSKRWSAASGTSRR